MDTDGWTHRTVRHSSPLARRAAFLKAAIDDLDAVSTALDRLAEDQAKPGPSDAPALQAWWSFAAMRYARLYTTGRRTNSVNAALKATRRELPFAADVHSTVMRLRNEHLAHVDRTSALDAEGAVVRVRQRGREMEWMLTVYVGRGISPSARFIAMFKSHGKVLIAHVRAEYQEVFAELEREVAQLSEKHLAQAPTTDALENAPIPAEKWYGRA